MSFHDSLRNASQQMRVRWARSRWRTRRRGPFGSQRSGESVGLSRLNRAPNRDSRRIQSTYSTASADVKSILRSRPAGRLRGEGGGTRCVYVNLPAPKNATSRHGTVTNKIRTAKYTLFTFLPKNLFEQFRRAANIYFLFMAALQVIPYFQVSSVFMTLFPICFVLSVTAAKDGFEDWKRHQQDREFNNTPTSTLQRWRNVNFEREDDPPPGWRGWVERVRRRLGLRKTEPAVASSMYTSSTDAPLTGHAAPAHSPSSALRRMNTYMPEEAAFQPAVWKDVRIGDIILLHNNDPVPADMVILSTSEPDNECYIETKNLDGETNLKTRRGVQETAYITDAIECARAQFYIESEPPTSNLYLYRGTLHMAREDAVITEEMLAKIAEYEVGEEDDENDYAPVEPISSEKGEDEEEKLSDEELAAKLLSDNFKSIRLDQENTLLRGSFLRNTEWVIGVAIFTGAETKIMLNAGTTPSKRSRIEKLMNRQVVINFVFLLILCIICAIAYIVYYIQWEEDGAVGLFIPDEGSNGGAAILNFLAALIVFQNIIPISLYISIEFVKTFHAFWIFSDLRMYDEENDQPCVPKTWNISDDLGQVEYIFSDKTGTLTRNIMEFRRCSIRGRAYGDLAPDQDTDAARGARLRAAGSEEEAAAIAAEEQAMKEQRVKMKREFIEELYKSFQPRYAVVDPDKLTFADPKLFIDLRGEELDEFADETTGAADVRSSTGSMLQMMSDRRSSFGPSAYNESMTSQAIEQAEEEDMESLDNYSISLQSSVLQRPRRFTHLTGRTNSMDQFSLNPSTYQSTLAPTLYPFTTRTQAIREYFLALALCHTVIVERPDEDKESEEILAGTDATETSHMLPDQSASIAPQPLERLNYRAESPDEDALVSAARNVGFAFLGRRRNEMMVDILGQTFVFELLNVLPFDSTRKRMSVIVRRPAPWNDIMLYIKGADNVILERLAPGQDELIARTNEHLESYSRDGLRVMLLGCKRIPQEVYDEWLRDYQAAGTAMVGRDALLNACAEDIERDLTLIGSTAIEDKLQDQVPEVIASLREAGIKVWVLTGDKLETAINIGYSCNLLTQSMQLWTVRGGEDPSQTVNQFIEIAKRVITSHADDSDYREQALVIDGQALKDILDNPRSRRYLLSLSTRCRSVICCRVSPLQKAQVVHLVRKGRHAITLAIGDGANDVSMIQTANIGVAITGQEGLQAAMSSDYTISQFRFLKPLLLIHGQWSYLRVAEMILNFFYKNVLYAMTVFFYQIYCGFSADIFCDYIYVQLYNLVFTLMPVLILGCCDQSVNALRAIHYPQLYKLGIEQRRYNMKRFWIYIIEAIANGAIIFFVFYFIYTYDPLSENGLVSSKQDFSSAVITIVITNAALFVGFNTYAWNWMMHAAVWGTIIVTLAFLAVISNIESADLYGVGSAVYGKASFWLASVIAIIITMLPRYLVTFVKQHFFPEDVDIVREMQKYHLDGISSQRKGTNADEKVPLMRQVQPVGESGSDQDADDSNSPTSIPMTQVDPPVPSPVLTAPHHASTQPSSMSSAPVTQPVSQ